MTKRNATADTTEALLEALPDPELDETFFTVKDLAYELGTNPKAFRRFLRSMTADRVGRGGRWIFDAQRADEIRTAWDERHTEALEDAEDTEDGEDAELLEA